MEQSSTIRFGNMKWLEIVIFVLHKTNAMQIALTHFHQRGSEARWLHAHLFVLILLLASNALGKNSLILLKSRWELEEPVHSFNMLPSLRVLPDQLSTFTKLFNRHRLPCAHVPCFLKAQFLLSLLPNAHMQVDLFSDLTLLTLPNYLLP